MLKQHAAYIAWQSIMNFDSVIVDNYDNNKIDKLPKCSKQRLIC